ncbi:unnamed protein product [Brassica oleracea]
MTCCVKTKKIQTKRVIDLITVMILMERHPMMKTFPHTVFHQTM